MNKNITIEIIQIKNNINKNDIAFAIYTNVVKENEEKVYNDIAELMGMWALKVNDIKLYVTDINNDILNIEDNKSNTKVIYLLNDNYENKLNYNKTNEYKKVYFTDEINNVENTYISIYSCFEKKLDDSVKFKPYTQNIYDYNGAEDFELEEELFTGIEEIFAKEIYVKSLILGPYHIYNNELFSYDGYEYSIVKNDYNNNSNIIEIINDTFDKKIRYEDVNNINKDKLIDILKEIYLTDTFELSTNSSNKLNIYIEELEDRLGQYKKTYFIIENEDEESIINSFFINMSTWVIIFEKGILIVSQGSNE